MRKLVVLRLDGDLELGVRVTLEIGEEGKRPSTEITGDLPFNPDMLAAIELTYLIAVGLQDFPKEPILQHYKFEK